MKIIIESPTDDDFFMVKQLAEECNLDVRDLKKEQFIVAKVNGNLAGFGRLKLYNGIAELGTFGVIPEYRDKGIGFRIVNELISKAPAELYIITTIPSYCYNFGFDLTDNAPESIQSSYYEYKSICKNKVYILKKVR